MMRNEWCAVAIGAALLAACGTDPGPVEDSGANPATEIGPSPEGSATSAAPVDWGLPAGVYRAVTPKEGTLDLHVEPGRFVVYSYVDDIPELGYAADCVPDDPSTVTCTARDGGQMVFGWDGTDEALTFTVLRGGEQGDHDVWEPVPWTRLS